MPPKQIGINAVKTSFCSFFEIHYRHRDTYNFLETRMVCILVSKKLEFIPEDQINLLLFDFILPNGALPFVLCVVKPK